jgi:flagella basal body P-ring formation protein FlgA
MIITINQVLLFLFSICYCLIAPAEELEPLNKAISSVVASQLQVDNVLVKLDSRAEVIDNYHDDIIVKQVSIENSKRFTAIIVYDGEERVAKGTYYKAKAIPVLCDEINQGTVIERSMLIEALIPLSSVKNNIISDFNSLVGKVAKKNIQKQKAIKENDIDHIDLVKKGDSVTIRYVNKNLVIETDGVSLENGEFSKLIRFKGMASKKILYGVVRGPGILEVGNR